MPKLRKIWMVRAGAGGYLVEEFLKNNIVAIGWNELGKIPDNIQRGDLKKLYKRTYPDDKKGRVDQSVGQIWRFINEFQIGDRVVTYAASRREYFLGKVNSPYKFSERFEFNHYRQIQWQRFSVKRDLLSDDTRYALGATLTIFKLSLDVWEELERLKDESSQHLTITQSDGSYKSNERPVFRKTLPIREVLFQLREEVSHKSVELNRLSSEVLYLRTLPEEMHSSKILLSDFRQQLQQMSRHFDELKDLIYDIVLFGAVKKLHELPSTPIEIYLDTEDESDISEVYQAISNYLQSTGQNITIDFNPVKGSWWKRLLARTKTAITHEEVTERLREAEYGLEVNTILKPQSEVDKNNAEAFERILNGLRNTPNGAVKIGSLIVVKVTDPQSGESIQARTLSIRELHLLNKKPGLLAKPHLILAAISQEVVETDESERRNSKEREDDLNEV